MKYMGSKNRIAKFILPLMLEEARKKNVKLWIEPFVGGGNMIDKVPDTFEKIGCDFNSDVIKALESIRDSLNQLPKNNKEFTEQDYNNLRKSDSYEFKSYAGFAFSYSGKWMGGWCRDKELKRDYVEESYKNALAQSPNLQKVNFLYCSFQELEVQNLTEKAIFYCDPPYKNTTKYNAQFNHDQFYDFCRKLSKLGHIVFISEYEMPEDFKCVWEMEVSSSLTQDTGSKKAIERLFTI